MITRSAADADRDAVLALGVAEETAWFGEPESSAAEVAEWLDSEGGVAAGVVATDDDGRVCGFALKGAHEDVFLAEPTQVAAVADALLPGLRPVRKLMTYGGDAERLAAFERHGFAHLRSAFTLARPAGDVPAAQVPAGIDVAPYVLGGDDAAVHRLIYVDAAWASVEGHAERGLEDWLEVTRACGTLLLATRDGRPVGWLAGRVLDSGRGFVQTLAVAGSERGRGLGRALLLLGFAALRDAGAADMTLGVEARNDAALGLYRSVGLAVEREWRIYG